MGTGLTVTSWYCISLTVLQGCETVSPLSEAFWQRSSGGRRRRDAVGVRGEADKHHKALWWWSECECRSHTFNKRLVLSHTNSYTPHRQETDMTTSMQIHKHTHAHAHSNKHQKTDCILNPAEPPTFINKMGSYRSKGCCCSMLCARSSLLNSVVTGAFYDHQLHADIEHQRLA